MSKENPILILGAGPAGLSCAMELHKHKKQAIILEKDVAVGGLAKTLTFKEGKNVFRTDIGPHRFFSKNKYLYAFIKDLLGKDWIKVNRKTRQFIEGKFYDYPIKAVQAFRNIGFFRAVGMGFSYVYAQLQYSLFKKKINNFEDFLVAHFGRKLAGFNMLNYSEKIWGIPCKDIHPEWGTQRIKGLSLRSALKDAVFKKKKEGPKSLVDQFYYPRFGTGTIYEAIVKKIKTGGSQVYTESFPTKIYHKNKHIIKIDCKINNEKSIIIPSQVVSSIPITSFVKMVQPRAPKRVIDAVNNLKWRSQVYVVITLDKERITDDNWIYFPNKNIPFGRLAEMKNFSDEMAPPGKSIIIVEYFVTEGDKFWSMDKEKLFLLTLKHCKKMGLFSKNEVRQHYVFKKKFVYPIYDSTYQENVTVVKEYLDAFKNLTYVGRPGRFFYTNQDHSLEMGIVTAKSIVEGKQIDLDTIGAEHEYFESGSLDEKTKE